MITIAVSERNIMSKSDFYMSEKQERGWDYLEENGYTVLGIQTEDFRCGFILLDETKKFENAISFPNSTDFLLYLEGV